MNRNLTALAPLRPRPYDGPATLAMRLLLVSLGVLFLGGLVGLWAAPGRTEPLRSVLPPLLWGSTASLVAGGIVLRRALREIRRYDRPAFRRSLRLALGGGVLFLVVQTPALAQLLARHGAEAPVVVGGAMPGLLFFLILLHALHVVGGLVALGWVALRAHADPRSYTPDYHTPVRYTVMYWGFLETVWLAMLAVFLIV
jgi:heme/copper-type cytochrome/quinol oxidase subunit 3